MNKPLVSVCIVTRDREEMLLECIKSVENQTYPNIEIILVDDGSKDSNLIGRSSPNYRPTTYIGTPPMGIASARNTAMEEAKGKYIFILDSDDQIVPDGIERSVELAEKTDADWVFSELTMVACDGIKPIGTFKSRIQTFEECYTEKAIPHPSSLIKKEFIGNTKYDTQFESAVDLDFTLALLLKNPKFQKLEEPSVLYRWHTNQESQHERQKDSANKIREKYQEIYEQRIKS